MPADDFGLFLFYRNPESLTEMVSCGASGLVVDWENWGKRLRQQGADTEINHHGLSDLLAVRQATATPILCRINGCSPATPAEVEAAIAGGASEILLPMVRTVAEVETVLGLVRGRCGLGILVETPEAIALAAQLGRLPLSRVFVGLNDLAIADGHANIFIPLADGTVERVREAIPMRLGFGGLTRPHLGSPIPCRLLLSEMVRLGSDFTFLRRSFWADSAGLDKTTVLQEIRDALIQAKRRPARQIAADHRQLRDAIRAWSPASSKEKSLALVP